MGGGQQPPAHTPLSSQWLLYQEEKQLEAGPFLKHLYGCRAGPLCIVLYDLTFIAKIGLFVKH